MFYQSLLIIVAVVIEHAWSWNGSQSRRVAVFGPTKSSHHHLCSSRPQRGAAAHTCTTKMTASKKEGGGDEQPSASPSKEDDDLSFRFARSYVEGDEFESLEDELEALGGDPAFLDDDSEENFMAKQDGDEEEWDGWTIDEGAYFDD